MDNKLEKFNKFKRIVFRFLLIFLFGLATLLFAIAVSKLVLSDSVPVFIDIVLVLFGILVLIDGLILIVCLPILFFKRLGVGGQIKTAEKIPAVKIKLATGLGYIVVSMIFLGFVFNSHLDAKKCDSPDCFVKLANSCTPVKWQTTDKSGLVWSYYSSSGCEFQKQLQTINGNDNASMKSILQGQNFTCKYQKNKFNTQWINSIIFGLEGCNGNLKESIGKLLLLLK